MPRLPEARFAIRRFRNDRRSAAALALGLHRRIRCTPALNLADDRGRCQGVPRRREGRRLARGAPAARVHERLLSELNAGASPKRTPERSSLRRGLSDDSSVAAEASVDTPTPRSRSLFHIRQIRARRVASCLTESRRSSGRLLIRRSQVRALVGEPTDLPKGNHPKSVSRTAQTRCAPAQCNSSLITACNQETEA